jgi:hypothetical protein
MRSLLEHLAETRSILFPGRASVAARNAQFAVQDSGGRVLLEGKRSLELQDDGSFWSPWIVTGPNLFQGADIHQVSLSVGLPTGQEDAAVQGNIPRLNVSSSNLLSLLDLSGAAVEIDEASDVAALACRAFREDSSASHVSVAIEFHPADNLPDELFEALLLRTGVDEVELADQGIELDLSWQRDGARLVAQVAVRP